MPVDIIRVERVDSTPTVRSDLQRYLVTGRHADASLGGFQAYTLNAMRAALCECAHRLGAAVRITWKDGRMHTRDIVDVTLEADADA